VRPLSGLKNALVPPGEIPRTIRLGINRGSRMYLDLRHDSQRWLGLYEREIYPFFRRHSEGLSTAIDVGAADGFYTLFFLVHTSADHVVAFEPSLRNRKRLMRNLDLNALGNTPRLRLEESPAGTHRGSVPVDLVWDGHTPCMVKIDVDGPEVDVLAGSERLLEAAGIVWIVETHGLSLERSCRDIFIRHGYRTAVVKNAPWRALIPEVRPIGHNRWLYAAR
jgi:hypothetical protein